MHAPVFKITHLLISFRTIFCSRNFLILLSNNLACLKNNIFMHYHFRNFYPTFFLTLYYYTSLLMSNRRLSLYSIVISISTSLSHVPFFVSVISLQKKFWDIRKFDSFMGVTGGSFFIIAS